MTSKLDEQKPIDRYAAAQNYFEHVEKQVSLATTKAQLLVAGLAFLLTAYVRLIVDAGVLKILDTTIRNGPTDWLAIVTWLLWALCGVPVVAAMICALYGTQPKSKVQNTIVDRSLFFFGHVADMSANEYLDAFGRAPDAVLLRDLLTQAYGKACWLKRMYRWIELANWSTIAALACGAIAMIFTAHNLV
jgi:Family of unknown function (DUF5706)